MRRPATKKPANFSWENNWWHFKEFNQIILEVANIKSRLCAPCTTEYILYFVYFQGHDDAIYCCAFDRNRVFTGGLDGSVYLWDIRSGRPVHELVGHKVSKPNTDPHLYSNHKRAMVLLHTY